jgi:hypothetical protein
VTVYAGSEDIWPWLVQLGQGRAGLYSYDWLESLVGCDIHSRDVIVPELQHLDIGDIVSMRRGDMPSFTVVAIYPQQALVLRSRDPVTGGTVDMDANQPMVAYYTWTFLLQPAEAGVTRLIERSRLRLRPNIGDRLFGKWWSSLASSWGVGCCLASRSAQNGAVAWGNRDISAGGGQTWCRRLCKETM